MESVFLCSSCGSGMEFSIEKQNFVCPSCGNVSEDIDTSRAVREFDFSTAELSRASAAQDWSDVHIVLCKACGAELSVVGANTVAECPYCGSSHVLTEKQSDGIPPEAILPFKVDKNRAGELFRRWISSRFWAPAAFKRLYQQDKLKPVYHPYWTYDASTFAAWKAEGGTVYYVTVGSGKNRRQVRRVRWTSIRGSWTRLFDDVLIDASQERNRLKGNASGYDTSDCAPFNAAYLAGNSASRYTRSPSDCWVEARQYMREIVEGEIRSHILSRYDEVRSLRAEIEYENVKFKHALLPLWTSGSMYGGKMYGCAINGQSGAIAGEYPKSVPKIVAAVLLGIAVVGTVVWFLSQHVNL